MVLYLSNCLNLISCSCSASAIIAAQASVLSLSHFCNGISYPLIRVKMNEHCTEITIKKLEPDSHPLS